MSDVTRVLDAIERGDAQATEQLLPLVYDELRKLASSKLKRELPGQTLQATALVHEAYLRLVNTNTPQHWEGRGHFFAAAAEAMRRILIDQARRRNSLKRGSQLHRVELDGLDLQSPTSDDDFLALNEALEKLEQLDRVKAELVKLRYFAGLTIPQAAQVLKISPSTADNYWAYARCWLRLELANESNQ
jgi:RNA polymerase sigma factor (TIGR02999 family)